MKPATIIDSSWSDLGEVLFETQDDFMHRHLSPSLSENLPMSTPDLLFSMQSQGLPEVERNPIFVEDEGHDRDEIQVQNDVANACDDEVSDSASTIAEIQPNVLMDGPNLSPLNNPPSPLAESLRLPDDYTQLGALNDIVAEKFSPLLYSDNDDCISEVFDFRFNRERKGRASPDESSQAYHFESLTGLNRDGNSLQRKSPIVFHPLPPPKTQPDLRSKKAEIPIITTEKQYKNRRRLPQPKRYKQTTLDSYRL
jgi:hypothetical protein